MKRVKIGDVLEVPTRKGLAYAQVTHRERLFGMLIRVLPGFHRERPRDLGEVARRKTQFVIFVPAQAMVNAKIVSVAGNEPVPEADREFPTFRMPMHYDSDGRGRDWWLWDGEREWRVGLLTPEQRNLPIRQVVNDTMLIDKIESEWTSSQGDI